MVNLNIKSPISIKRKVTIIAIVIAVVAIAILYKPMSEFISTQIEKSQFQTLDSDMQNLYNEIKSAASNDEDWRYRTVCSRNYRGDWPDNTYNCITSISLKKLVSSTEELNYFQNKYYPMVDKSNVWDQSKSGSLQTIGIGDTKFVVSTGEKQYTEKNTGESCTYRIAVEQTLDNYSDKNILNEVGELIKNDQGDFFISVRCSKTASYPWFNIVSDTSYVIPD
ncbi:hypothetical protein HGB24_03500 [Candidatus Saccharibacteria bacterium]|nr:hypothetical protein [Candidatus Saccharibacteria bacterium]